MYAARSVAARPPPGEDEAASWVEIQLMAAEGTALAGSDDEDDDDEAAAAPEADAEADIAWWQWLLRGTGRLYGCTLERPSLPDSTLKTKKMMARDRESRTRPSSRSRSRKRYMTS